MTHIFVQAILRTSRRLPVQAVVASLGLIDCSSFSCMHVNLKGPFHLFDMTCQRRMYVCVHRRLVVVVVIAIASSLVVAFGSCLLLLLRCLLW